MAVRSSDWLNLMSQEYLRRFIPGGGSAIKFVMGGDDTLRSIAARLSDIAKGEDYRFAEIDAAETRIHMIQDIFFALARTISWETLAQAWMENVFRENRYDWPEPGQSVGLRELASVNRMNDVLLRKDVKQWITDGILRDTRLAQDFRFAMGNLCMRTIEPGDARATAPVIDWLNGDLRTIGPVKDVPISGKITRNNGHVMLRSLCNWVRMCGRRGVIVTIDIRRLGVAKLEGADGLKFGPGAVLDAYEVFRQIIDDAENFEGLFLTVLADPAFREDTTKRSVSRYPALKQRIWPDVHARGHENPLTPLLHLEDSGKAPPASVDEAILPYNSERVAVEALRAGVPNRAAIRQLGSSETRLCERFLDSLRNSRVRMRSGEAVEGTMISGAFGAGKSHLLGYLAELALKENFVVSVVPISKQTPLFDHQKVYSAAIRSAKVSDSLGSVVTDDVMTVVMNRLDTRSEAYLDLEEWVSDDKHGFSAIFAALLHLIPRQVIQPDDLAAIARFFAGSRLALPKVKQWLRSDGLAPVFPLKATKVAELALQRLRFAPRLFSAAGYNGWCILLDEVDLIARYSTLQRGKSYAELCRWLSLDASVSVPGVVSVAAITSDFADEVLHLRLDQERVPEILRNRGWEDIASRAEKGMQIIEKRATRLSPPDDEQLHRNLDTVRKLYSESYGWPPYGGEIGERTAKRTMREYIKAWVTAWDIYRLYGAEDKIDTDTLSSDYTEDKDLEKSPDDDASDDDQS